MKVKCKAGNRFLIKNEWYQVVHLSDGAGISENLNAHRADHYELINHTDRKWHNNWYSSVNFFTLYEIRDIKLDLILD